MSEALAVSHGNVHTKSVQKPKKRFVESRALFFLFSFFSQQQVIQSTVVSIQGGNSRDLNRYSGYVDHLPTYD